MHAKRFRRADERAEVLRVLQGIKHQDKRQFPACVFEDIEHIRVRVSADFSHDALIVLVHLVQFGTPHTADLDLLLSRQLENLLDLALLLHPFGDLDPKYLPAFGAQGFVDCVTGIDEFFHISQL